MKTGEVEVEIAVRVIGTLVRESGKLMVVGVGVLVEGVKKSEFPGFEMEA